MKQVDFNNCEEISHCGPVAIAAITGLPLRDVLNRVRKFRHNDLRVGGMEDYEIVGVLESMEIYPDSRPSAAPSSTIRTIDAPTQAAIPTNLAKFCEEHPGGPYLVVIGSRNIRTSLHVIAIDNGMICCSQTGGVPVPISEYHSLNSNVMTWWKF